VHSLSQASHDDQSQTIKHNIEVSQSAEKLKDIVQADSRTGTPNRYASDANLISAVESSQVNNKPGRKTRAERIREKEVDSINEFIEQSTQNINTEMTPKRAHFDESQPTPPHRVETGQSVEYKSPGSIRNKYRTNKSPNANIHTTTADPEMEYKVTSDYYTNK
jgi:hypothetical protein